MMEFIVANIAEILLAFVATAVSGLVAVLKGTKAKFEADMLERKKLWDEQMIHINHKFDELLGDHKDIKRMQQEGAEKIVSLERQHAEHERDQAVQLEILRDIKEQLRGKQ